MEFFEKAHVHKRNRSTKDKKADENKKRLKQMLYGYKNNDNITIKESANRPVDLEDVNSYSEDDIDIPLPRSSNCDMINSCAADTSSSTDLEDGKISELSYEKGCSEQRSFEPSFNNMNQSITQFSEDEITSILSDKFSFENTTSPEQGSETESFDADGVLASKILKKLKKIEKNNVKPSKSNKRKLQHMGFENNSAGNMEKELGGVKEKVVKKKKEKVKGMKVRNDTIVKDVIQHSSINDDQPSCSSSLSNMQVVHKSKVAKQKLKNNDAKKKILQNQQDSLSPKYDRYLENSENSNSPHSAGSRYDEEVESCSTQSLSSPVVTYEAEESIYYQGFNDILSAYKNPTITSTPSTIPIISSKDNIFKNMYHYDVDDDAVDDSDTTEVNESVNLEQNTEDIEVPDDNSLIEVSSNEARNPVQFSPEPQRQEEELDQLIDIEQNDDSLVEMMQGDLAEEPIDYANQCRILFCNNSCVFVMQHPAELYIHGKLTVVPLGGTAEVLGHTLKRPCNIYAPHIYYPQCLKTVQCENSYYGLFGKMTSLGLAVYDVEDIVSNLGIHDVVIQLKPLESHKLDFVENNFNVTDLFRKHTKSFDEHLIKISEMLGCSLSMTRPTRYFKESVNWGPALKSGYKKQSRCIVSGGKGTGKSTFVRYYVNKQLDVSPVLLLDLDPGQCEFTVAGNISATVVTEPLLGPSFTHLKKPDRMLNVGMINVMDNLRRYANAVSSLITYCYNNEQYHELPWIINTMGMCNTVGLKLISFIIMHLKPTFMLQFQSNNPKRRFECNLDSITVIHKYLTEFKDDELFRDVVCPEKLDYGFILSEQCNIEGVGKGNYCLAPRDERYLNFLAYFGELLDIHRGPGFLSITPYEVPLQHLKIGANIKLDTEATDKVINGKVIALCQQHQDSVGKMFTLNDKPLLCHGHGLIRGIDCEKGMLYIVTPTPADKLSLVDTVVYADWVPELRGQEKHLPGGTAVPYRMPTLLQQRQLTHVPRRRFNPLQFLKMSRSS